MANVLDNMTPKEVDDLTQEFGGVNSKVAKHLGITVKDLTMYRSKHNAEFRKFKKERDKIKAQEEIGLIVKEEKSEPKTTQKKGASTIPVVETIEKTKYDELNDKYNVLKQQYDDLETKQYEMSVLEAGLRTEIDIEKKEKLTAINDKEKAISEIEGLKDKIKTIEKEKEDFKATIKETERKAKNMPNLENKTLKAELIVKEQALKQHQQTIEKAGETNKIIREELEKQESQNIDMVAKISELEKQLEHKDTLYQNAMSAVAECEADIKEKQTKIDEQRKEIVQKTHLSNKLDNERNFIKHNNEELKDAFNSQQVTIKNLEEEKNNLINSLKEVEDKCLGYHNEIISMTTHAQVVPEDIATLQRELTFYKHHAMKYFELLETQNNQTMNQSMEVRA